MTEEQVKGRFLIGVRTVPGDRSRQKWDVYRHPEGKAPFYVRRGYARLVIVDNQPVAVVHL